jgi:hypothetical protein
MLATTCKKHIYNSANIDTSMATLTAGVQERRQAWGVAGTSPPHTVRDTDYTDPGHQVKASSHCACPLNFCLFSGNYGGLTKCVHAQPSLLLPGRGWAGAPEAICGLCGSTGACVCIQLVPIPVGVTVCAVVHEGAGELCFFVASLHASAVLIYKGRRHQLEKDFSFMGCH